MNCILLLLIAYHGECGDNASFTINSGGDLKISGTGIIDKTDWSEEMKKTVRKIIIEDGITEIGANAFNGMKNMTSIRFPDTLTHIHSGALANNPSLTHAAIPEGVTNVDDDAFSLCIQTIPTLSKN